MRFLVFAVLLVVADTKWVDPVEYAISLHPELYDTKHPQYDPSLATDLDRRTSLSLPPTMHMLQALHSHFTTLGQGGVLNIYVLAAVYFYEKRANWEALWEARPPGLHTLNVLVAFASVPEQPQSCLNNRDLHNPQKQGLNARCDEGHFPDMMDRGGFSSPPPDYLRVLCSSLRPAFRNGTV